MASEDVTGEETRVEELERRLRESEARFEALLSRAGDGMFMVDGDGRFLFVNDFIARSSGFPRQAFVGRSFLELIRPEDRDRARRNFERAAAGERMPAWELAYHTANGEPMWVEVSATPVIVGGEVTGVFGVSRNIQQRKQIELALRESEEKYRTLIETLPHVVGILQDSKLVFVNATAKQWFGFDPVADPRPLEGFLAPTQRTRVMDLMRRREQGESLPMHYRTTLARTDGTEFPVEVFVHPITYRGRPAIQAVAIDISERQALEEQLQQIQKMEALGTLAGGIAHDFNNLLTAILAAVGLLKRQSPENEAVFESADTIELAARRAGSLTQQLLGFARKSSPERKAVDVAEVIDEVCCILSRTLAKEIGIVKRHEAAEARALGDQGQLQQVVMNLVVNARDAMPEGGEIAIETSVVELHDDALLQSFEIASGDYLRIRVRDEGVGIPADVRERMFEPFYSTKPQGQGSGMGLAVVYGIVRAHHGAIEVDSRAEVGTDISIYLPVAAEQACAPEVVREVPQKGRGVVMLVDDEDLLRQSATAVLKSLGYQVVVCRDGAEAVQLYRGCGEQIDVALIDVSMPGMNGWACLRELRRINPGLKAIMSSGYGRKAPPGYEAEAAVEFLPKPYVVEDLASILGRVIDGGAAT